MNWWKPRPKVVPASKKRFVLAVYLDLLIFNTVVGLLPLALPESLSWPAGNTFFRNLVAFGLLEVLLQRFVRWSPGNYLLAIRHRVVPAQTGEGSEDAPAPRLRAVVDPDTKRRESWLTLLTGTLLLLEGSKGLVRWSLGTPPAPWFGGMTPEEVWPMVAMTTGAIEWVVAVGIFRLRTSAAALGTVYFGISLVSVIQSWHLWPVWAAESLTRRRALQGFELRPGEIELVQEIAPHLALGGVVLFLVLVVFSGLRIAESPKGTTR